MEGADYGAAVRVLRDSGSTVLLVVKRRSTSNSANSSGNNSTLQFHRFTLTRNNKKDGKDRRKNELTYAILRVYMNFVTDFGIILGCRLYIKDVVRDNIGVKPGDVLTRIGGVATDNLSLKDAKKIIDQSKESLSIVVTRDASATCNTQHLGKTDSAEYLSGGIYSSQNLYVPPPTRQPLEDKSNLVPRGRSRGPLMDVSLSQLDLPATPIVETPRVPSSKPEGK